MVGEKVAGDGALLQEGVGPVEVHPHLAVPEEDIPGMRMAHPFDTPLQHILSTHPSNARPVNTHPINTPLNAPY